MIKENENDWLPIVYDELRCIAMAMTRREDGRCTLGPTELVHETWLRLRESRNAPSLSRHAFLGLAAQSMRRILTDRARARARQKRGGDWRRTTVSGKAAPDVAPQFLVELDLALQELANIDEALARLAELKIYGQCSIEEIAAALVSSDRTVKRRWRFVRAWLTEKLSETQS